MLNTCRYCPHTVSHQMRDGCALLTQMSRECCANVTQMTRTKFALEVHQQRANPYANGARTSRGISAHHRMLLLVPLDTM
jgi:hypothetical protein